MTSHMFAEAAEAPEAVARQLRANRDIMNDLARRLQAMAPRMVVTVARGSSDNAATYAKYLIETRLGILTASAAPSVSSVYGARPAMKDVLVLALSQSGRSPDLLAALKAARMAGAFIIGFVNAENSPLAAIADVTVPLHAGPELSVAATKSYIATNAALASLVAAWRKDESLLDALDGLSAGLADAWNCDWSAALPLLKDAHDLYVIGRGLGFGAAQEAALKFKETCALHAEAFSAAEVLHGPMALVKEGFPLLILSQDDGTRPGIMAMAARFARSRAQMMVAGFEHPHATALPVARAEPALEPLLLIQSFYRMAEALAHARGRDPDAPPNLKKITETV